MRYDLVWLICIHKNQLLLAAKQSIEEVMKKSVWYIRDSVDFGKKDHRNWFFSIILIKTVIVK